MVYQTHKSQPLAAQVRQQTTHRITLAQLEQRELLAVQVVVDQAAIQAVLAPAHLAVEQQALRFLVVLEAAERVAPEVRPQLQMVALAVMLQQTARAVAVVVLVNPAALAHSQAHTHQLLETLAMAA